MSNSVVPQILCEIANLSPIRPLRSILIKTFLFIWLQIISVFALLQSLFNWLLNGLRKWPMQRTLAPLRRIVLRSMEVIEASQMSLFETAFTKSTPFAVIDRLECGHETTSLLWGFRDLVNAYSDSPWVKARHHRCRECAKAIARNERKPVKSVRLVVQRAVAV